jgi:hypothetical protein
MPTRPQRQPKTVAAPPRCFRCDGTGEICDVCGEAPGACRCGEDASYSPCDSCKGTGR